LIHLSLHVGDSVRHVGQQLSLDGEKLLHPCWWRLVLLTVLRVGSGVVARSRTFTKLRLNIPIRPIELTFTKGLKEKEHS
jgi:hypothetical protein